MNCLILSMKFEVKIDTCIRFAFFLKRNNDNRFAEKKMMKQSLAVDKAKE